MIWTNLQAFSDAKYTPFFHIVLQKLWMTWHFRQLWKMPCIFFAGYCVSHWKLRKVTINFSFEEMVGGFTMKQILAKYIKISNCFWCNSLKIMNWDIVLAFFVKKTIVSPVQIGQGLELPERERIKCTRFCPIKFRWPVSWQPKDNPNDLILILTPNTTWFLMYFLIYLMKICFTSPVICGSSLWAGSLGFILLKVDEANYIGWGRLKLWKHKPSDSV